MSVSGDPFPQAAAAAFLERLGLSAPRSWEALQGGANNRVYRLALADGETRVLKSYFTDPGDPRDRFQAESDFYRLTEKARSRQVPRACGWDPEARLGLFEHIAGRPLSGPEEAEQGIGAALALLEEVNALRSSEEARRTKAASEACFCWKDHLDLIGRRIGRLRSIEPEDDADREAVRFIESRLVPAWQAIHDQIAGTLPPDARDRPLPWEDRCLSPSDFGFHNALRRADGSLCFFDFEYAGWDDPAKLIGDFFSQPRVPVPAAHFDRFLQHLRNLVPGADALEERARALQPAYRIKWCAIALNEFTPQGKIRRAYARFSPSLAAAHKLHQLDVARKILATASDHP